MVDLGKKIREAVAKAAAIVDSAMVDVTHEPFLERDSHNKPTYADPVDPSPRAVVSRGWHVVRTPDGEEQVVRVKLTFPGNVAISTDDRLTLPDGTTGNVVVTKSTDDPGGGNYSLTVWLGQP